MAHVLADFTDDMSECPPRVLHLWAVTGSSGLHNSVDAFKQLSQTGFYTQLALIQLGFERGLCDGLEVMIVADGLAQMAGEEQTLHAEKTALLGACRDIPFEIPGVLVRCIDVLLFEDPQESSWLAQAIINEAWAKHIPQFVAFHANQHFVEQMHMVPDLPQSSPFLRARGTMLITDGTGGLGMKFADELYDSCRARLVLTSRWQLPLTLQWPKRTQHAGRRVHRGEPRLVTASWPIPGNRQMRHLCGSPSRIVSLSQQFELPRRRPRQDHR